MNLEQALTEYRRYGLPKQTVVHEACHSCPLFVGVLTEGQDTWTMCDLFSETETPKDLLSEARGRYGDRSEEKKRRYLFNRGCA